MQIRPIGSNQTELIKDDGTIILFSYETPVAAYSAETGEYLRTKDFFSVTTSRHLNKWLGALTYREVDQDYLDSLVSCNYKAQALFNPSSEHYEAICKAATEDLAPSSLD